jgi:hypothetical protein
LQSCKKLPGSEEQTKMAMIVTGNATHDAALLAAERARQSVNIPGATAAQLKAGDISYARACLSSCINNNSGSGAEQFSDMLRELGTGGA